MDTSRIPIIDDSNAHLYANPSFTGRAAGLIPRDYEANPVGCFAFAEEFPDSMLIPESEWAARLAAQMAVKATLLDLREANYDTLKSLDQDGLGLCWAFSTTKACMYIRARMGEPNMRLSAWWVAGKVKGWRDQGGWGGESLEQIVKSGVPTETFCPSYKASYDTPDCQANAALHKFTEWWEGAEDSAKARKQAVSAFLLGYPCIIDLNSMSHSMCAIGFELDPFTIIYDNSWGEGGEKGLYKGRGASASPNGLWIPRAALPSEK